MGPLKSSSHRERDYSRVTSRLKAWYYTLRRGNIISQSIDRVKWNLAPKFFHVIDFPTHIDIEASLSCQMRCPMCLRRRMPQDLTYGIMDFDLFKKIIDECNQRSIYSVKLSWRGEPLLNPHIVEMVKYAKERGIKDVAFLTNGERLTPELAMGLTEAGLDWISFSIDGVGEIYERIRWPETFEGIVRKVRFLKEYRDSKGLRKPLIRVQTIYSAIKENPTEYFDLWERIADKVYIIADQARWEIAPFPRDPNYVCFEPWRRIVIGWNGLVPQCICDYEDLNPLGDVSKQAIHEVWHGEKFNKLRESIKNRMLFTNEPCKECHDPGLMYNETVKIGDREIVIGLYKGQAMDIKNMDARPKART